VVGEAGLEPAKA